MTFNVQRLVLASTGGNAGMETTTDTAGNELIVNGPQLWTYESSTDLIATIAADNYFSEKAFAMSVGDIIVANGTDASNMFIVATVDTTVVPNLITVVSFTPAGTVATANIENAAVTFAKIQDVATVSLLGNPTGGSTVTSEITLGAGLAFSGTTLITPATNLRYVAVPITASELNGMYAAPKLLVAAAGANTLIVPVSCQLLLTYGSAAYAAGGVAALQWDSTANGAGTIASTTQAAANFQVTASTGLVFNAGVVAEAFTACANKGIYLSNITGAFTTGNSTLVAHLWYRVIPTV